MFLRIFYLQDIPQRTIIYILKKKHVGLCKVRPCICLLNVFSPTVRDLWRNDQGILFNLCLLLLLVEEPSPPTGLWPWPQGQIRREPSLDHHKHLDEGYSGLKRPEEDHQIYIEHMLFRSSIRVLKHEPGPLPVSALSQPLSPILRDEAGVEVV